MRARLIVLAVSAATLAAVLATVLPMPIHSY